MAKISENKISPQLQLRKEINTAIEDNITEEQVDEKLEDYAKQDYVDDQISDLASDLDNKADKGSYNYGYIYRHDISFCSGQPQGPGEGFFIRLQIFDSNDSLYTIDDVYSYLENSFRPASGTYVGTGEDYYIQKAKTEYLQQYNIHNIVFVGVGDSSYQTDTTANTWDNNIFNFSDIVTEIEVEVELS